MTDDPARPSLFRLALALVVPYCAATHGALGARFEALRHSGAPV